jgi:hypothetical protein
VLRITDRERFEAVASKTLGDEPDQIFHKGSRFSRTAAWFGATATRKFSRGIYPPRGGVARAGPGVVTAISIHFGGMVSVMGSCEVPSHPLFLSFCPLSGVW